MQVFGYQHCGKVALVVKDDAGDFAVYTLDKAVQVEDGELQMGSYLEALKEAIRFGNVEPLGYAIEGALALFRREC